MKLTASYRVDTFWRALLTFDAAGNNVKADRIYHGPHLTLTGDFWPEHDPEMVCTGTRGCGRSIAWGFAVHRLRAKGRLQAVPGPIGDR